jgi:hypothetical protein
MDEPSFWGFLFVGLMSQLMVTPELSSWSAVVLGPLAAG